MQEAADGCPVEVISIT
ncbi:MAG: hypothetical protein ACOC80_14515 [Petrotogales bacterium]